MVECAPPGPDHDGPNEKENRDQNEHVGRFRYDTRRLWEDRPRLDPRGLNDDSP